MRPTIYFIFYTLVSFSCCVKVYCQIVPKKVTLDEVIDSLALVSSTARIEKLNFQNELLQFENYQKSYLPAFSFNMNPLNFNRSLRLLQHPTDGSYSYVDDYSNNSSMGVSIKQKIGLTGGELSIGSDINYMNEFSQKRSSFNTMPFSVGYSQQLWGGGKLYRLEKEIEHTKNEVSIKQYCGKLSQIQQQALNLFMSALLNRMEQDLTRQTKQNNDTLLHIARIKLNNGSITEYDLKQIELQSFNTLYAHENANKNYVEAQERLAVFLETDDLDVVAPVFSIPLSIDIHSVMFYVKENNPFSKQQEIQRLEAERNLFSTQLSNRFNGNISLNYGINQYAETFMEAYKHGNTRQAVVVGFQIPIFQWGINKNRIRMARNDYEASTLAIDKRIREFESEIKEKVNNYNHSVKLWFTAEKAYQLSQEQYKMLIQKFSLGKVSVYELTAAQNDQNSAMQRYYTAIRDSYDSYFSLRSLALYDFKRGENLEYLFIKSKS